MTKEEFVSITILKKFDLIVNYILCIGVIVVSIFFEIKFYRLFDLNLSKTNFFIVIFLYFIVLALFALGCYGIFVLTNPFKVIYWNNGMSEIENNSRVRELFVKLNASNFQKKENFIQFEYKKSFWSYTYLIFFLVEDNLIAVNIKIIDSNPKGGFLDFGARARIQKKIISHLKN